VSSSAETFAKAQVPPPTEAAPEPPEPAEPAPGGELPVTVIERRKGWQVVDLRELWRYRELLFFLAWRDVKVRYKQTVLGAAWALLQPFATMLVFALFLGRLGGVSSGIKNYSLFVFAGLIPWTFFQNAITSASSSVVSNQNLITKVYFPRLTIPMGAVGAGLVDFVITVVMLFLMMPFYGEYPGWSIVLAPLVVLLFVLAALGVGTMLSALTVAYRDFRYVVPFGVQLWMFATPCIYLEPAVAGIGPNGQALLPLNPVYGLTLNFRLSMLGLSPDWYSLAVSGAVSIGLLVLGCLYFRRVERGFADII
jgi:lipopolysaccharide transport system permease protein